MKRGPNNNFVCNGKIFYVTSIFKFVLDENFRSSFDLAIFQGLTRD